VYLGPPLDPDREPVLDNDLKWWQEVLSKPGFYHSLKPPGQLVDLGIWVNASTNWGTGIIWAKTQWSAWKLLSGWDANHWRNIGWAEGVAVELSLNP
jgi:hypothetical protein